MAKTSMKNIVIICLLIIITGLVWFIYATGSTEHNPTANNPAPTASSTNNDTGKSNKQMDLVVYRQDVEAAATVDCGVTYAETVQVPRTKSVADASLEYLFADELAQYGEYVSVSLEDGTAQVRLSREDHPNSSHWSSLSSCQSQHLVTVITDTLLQYDTITAVELYSPTGKIQF